MPRYSVFVFALFVLFVVGCDRAATPTADGSAPVPVVEAAAAPTSVTPRGPIPRTADELHAALKAENPNYNGTAQIETNGDSIVVVVLENTGASDLSPLAGLPLEVLYAENSGITDLSPLKGMRLAALSLNGNPVEDISPLRGMPLKELRLAYTKVRDLSPLRGAPLGQLWVDDTPVFDIGPLAGAPLVSLTIKGTRVSDIEVVRRMPLLERLNLGDAPVTDLSPVAGLRLTRLIFDPKTAVKGLEAARNLQGLREIGPSLEQMGPPAQFWAAYDAGAFK